MEESPATSADQAADIFDIILPEPQPNYWMMALWIVLGMAALAAVAWLLWHFVREDRLRGKRESSPRTIALSQLARLEAEAAGMEPNAFALRVSEIVKDFLHSSHGDRFRFETAEEFLTRANDGRASSLPAPTREAIGTFVAMCEELKFGRPGDAAQRCAPLPDQARRIFQSPSGHTAGQSPAASSSDHHAATTPAAG